jgi:hypothetical protein
MAALYPVVFDELRNGFSSQNLLNNVDRLGPGERTRGRVLPKKPPRTPAPGGTRRIWIWVKRVKRGRSLERVRRRHLMSGKTSKRERSLAIGERWEERSLWSG